MTSLYTSRLTNLQYFFNDRIKEWAVEEILVEVCPSIDSDETIQLNLVETTASSRKCIQASLPGTKAQEVYWLPQSHNQNNPECRKKVIAPLFVIPCKDAGFNIRLKGWEAKHNRLRFCCQRGRMKDGKI